MATSIREMGNKYFILLQPRPYGGVLQAQQLFTPVRIILCYTYITSQVSHYRQTSNWIWFPLVQSELDAWVTWQNAHRIRRQSAKLLPSGGRPDHFYENPRLYGGEPCLIPVDAEVIDSLLEQCDEGMEKLRYVDVEFEEIAKEAFKAVGSPQITLQSAWTVF